MSKKREIKLKTKNIQIDAMDEKCTIENSVDATIYTKDSTVYILYNECEETEMEETRTRIKIDREGVSIKRTGKIESEMHFNTIKAHDFDYRTPYGVLKMSIETKKVMVDIKEDITGSTIELNYDMILIGNDSKMENKLSIEVLEERKTELKRK